MQTRRPVQGDPEAATEDVEEVDTDILRRWIIPPRHRHKIKWDIFVGILIFYSCLVIPYRIGFGVEGSAETVVFDIMVDLVFLFDMIACFRTGFQTPEGVLDTVPMHIRQTYLKSWFPIDFFSTFPIDRIVEAALKSGSSGGDSNVGNQARAVKLIRIIRLIRLLKLARLLKMGKLMKSFEEVMSQFPLLMKFGKLGFNLTFLAHLIACFWYYVGTSVDKEDPSSNQCTAGGLGCDPTAPPATWWDGMGYDDDDEANKYLTSIYWAFTTITTVGYGDITPTNTGERIYAIVVMVGGATVFGYIIGSIAALAGQDRGSEALVKKKLASVLAYSEEQCFSKATEDALKAHYQFFHQERSPYPEHSHLSQLPNALRTRATMWLHREVIERIGLFKGKMPDWATVVIVTQLEPQACVSGEVIWKPSDPVQDVFFVYSGECEGWEYRTEEAAPDEEQQDKQQEPQRPLCIFTQGCVFGLEGAIDLPKKYRVIAGVGGSTMYLLKSTTIARLAVTRPRVSTLLQNALADIIHEQIISNTPQKNAECWSLMQEPGAGGEKKPRGQPGSSQRHAAASSGIAASGPPRPAG